MSRIKKSIVISVAIFVGLFFFIRNEYFCKKTMNVTATVETAAQ